MKSIFLSLLVLFTLHTKAQCFDIKSILVDGCDASNEGKNEMVTFTVGSSSLSVTTLTVNWPANPWLGVCQSASTATSVALINSTILGCGYLKEPVGGVLRANSKVLLVTSTDFNPLASSFVNLSDTMYIIFQCAGNIGGHFANYSSTPGLRTLTMNFGGACSDVVTYERSLLVKFDLTLGAQDGGAVDFDAVGTATYVNRGCTAPFVPLFVDAGVNKSVCNTSTVSLTATAGGGYNTINWSLGAGATGSFTPTNSLTTTYTPGIGDANIIKLYATITKICGTATVTVKDSVNVTVLQRPLPVISATSNSICAGSTSVLSFSLSNASSTGTTTALWNPSSSTSNSITVSTAGVYTVQVGNACGNNSATYSISSLPSPSVTLVAGGSTTFCPGGSVTFSATSASGNYLWTGGATTSSLNVSTTQTVVVTTTNSCGSASASVVVIVTPLPSLTVTPSTANICVGGSVIASAITNTTVTYHWSTGASTQTVSLTSPGIYTVGVTNVCGSATGSLNVTVGTVPTITVAATNAILCPSQTATLSFVGSTGTVLWNTGATTSAIFVNTAGVYTASVTNSCGTATSAITVTTSVLPTVILSPSAFSLCPTQTVGVIAISNVSTYSWSNGATANSAIINTPGITTVTVSNVCGTATASINVIANTLPVINLTASAYTLCQNQTATITATGGSTTYTWSNSASTGSVVSSNGGTVSVSSSNICGTTTETLSISVVNVDASISANPMSGTKPLIVDFTNSSTGGTNYLWNFGNGILATTQTVAPQTYTNGGSYTVYLTVTNGPCADKDSLTIIVYDEEPYLIIPNVFTPNGDNSNELFKIKGFNIIEFTCTIFNRWGLELFKWNGMQDGWDGKINSKDADDGVYFFVIQAKDINDKEIKKQGAFSLLR